MVYEKMKKWGFDQKKRRYEKAGLEWNVDADKLVGFTFFLVSAFNSFRQSNTAYTFMSITSKIAALAITYPYQVVRSRIQVCKYT